LPIIRISCLLDFEIFTFLQKNEIFEIHAEKKEKKENYQVEK